MNNGSQEPKRWVNTWAYRKAKAAVDSLLNSPQKVLALLAKVSEKSDQQVSGPVAKTIESVKVLLRLMTAYVKGDYRAVSLDNISIMLAALMYFAMPLDALPDFIVVLGLTDDAAVLAWTWSVMKHEVEAFLAWELAQETLPSTKDEHVDQHETR